MRKILSIAIACLALTQNAAARNAYAYLRGDTMAVGNHLVERKFLWNNGNLVTHSLTDKVDGHTWFNHSDQQDFYIIDKPQTANGIFKVEEVAESEIRPSYLTATVEYRLGGLDIRRVYRIYEDAPVIGLDTYLKGDPNGMIENSDIEASDLRNVEFPDEIALGQDFCLLDRFKLDGLHWDLKAIEFFDVTDINNTLTLERNLLPYRRNLHRGNLLFARHKTLDKGFFFLKEAPCSNVQLGYNGFDFLVEFQNFGVGGLGITDKDIKKDEWTRTYSVVLGLYANGELNALKGLRAYQKNVRKLTPEREEMIMMNTWGDRGQDTKITEQFCLAELEKGARLGISHFQIDDGWQVGRSPNSAFANGSFNDIYKNKDYWKPSPDKFPNGLMPVVERGKELGVEVCLWFNPSTQNNFADWSKDAETLIGIYRDYGIRMFKIDGLKIPNKEAEINLRNLFDRVLAETDNQVMFNLDATAGRRGGYHMFNEYGNTFLENRYTDWGNYFPYTTLRNLWQLSKYVPAEKLQIEFLNKWRNTELYGDDIYAPKNYQFEYLFAITMAAQPLAWFESHNLPEEAFEIAPVIKKYREIQHDFHCGTILPIGDEPSGNSWTGFQSIGTDDQSGYLLLFREYTPTTTAEITTWLPEGKSIEVTKILGEGSIVSDRVSTDGKIRVTIPQSNGYVLMKYQLTDYPTLNAARPRVLVNSNRFDEIKLLAATDTLLTRYIGDAIARADKFLEMPLPEREIISGVMLDMSRDCLDRIITLAAAYRLTDDPRYARRAEELLLKVCRFTDWNFYHFLDVAEMATAVSVGYDWLHEFLEHEVREEIRLALIRNALVPGLAVYDSSPWQYWLDVEYNWNQVCHGGLIIASLAIADTDPVYAEKIIPRAIKYMPSAMTEFGPDGAWNEGVSYWFYATRYATYAFSTMLASLGTDFGLSDITGFSKAGYFPIQMTSPSGRWFSFSDINIDNGSKPLPPMFWLADRFDNPDFADFERKILSRIPATALDVIYYSPKTTGGHASYLPLDSFFGGKGEFVTMRQSHNNSLKGLFVAVSGGDNRLNHGHLDKGSFELEKDGVEWIRDLGSDNYHLPGYWEFQEGGKRWDYFRIGSLGHAVPVINGKNQLVNAFTHFERIDLNCKEPIAVIDLTEAYAGQANSVKRQFQLKDNRHCLVVTDTYAANDSTKHIQWQVITDAEVIGKGRNLTLKKDGKKLEIKLLTPGQTFRVESAEQTAPQAENKGFKKILVEISNPGPAEQIKVSFK